MISEMETEQKQRAASDLSDYEKELDAELAMEEKKHKQNMSMLENRKQEMIIDREKKVQVRTRKHVIKAH